ncbi:hypothetical protein D1AOALGA4SA_6783 [Olavius algarvensis Delta 1 endosymbiont]|nr:hypothetical protein D1AOALGA4SA_6783 [Olavius algarvensis Delta 1 endosymbiont]
MRRLYSYCFIDINFAIETKTIIFVATSNRFYKEARRLLCQSR